MAKLPMLESDGNFGLRNSSAATSVFAAGRDKCRHALPGEVSRSGEGAPGAGAGKQINWGIPPSLGSRPAQMERLHGSSW
jgi:hypothetical protein